MERKGTGRRRRRCRRDRVGRGRQVKKKNRYKGELKVGDGRVAGGINMAELCMWRDWTEGWRGKIMQG